MPVVLIKHCIQQTLKSQSGLRFPAGCAGAQGVCAGGGAHVRGQDRRCRVGSPPESGQTAQLLGQPSAMHHAMDSLLELWRAALTCSQPFLNRF